IRLFLTVLYLAGPAVAQTGTPTTTPATTLPATPAPAVAAGEASTPRGALRVLILATDTGDETVIRERIYTASPLEEKMADATARAAAAMPALHRAMSAAF